VKKIIPTVDFLDQTKSIVLTNCLEPEILTYVRMAAFLVEQTGVSEFERRASKKRSENDAHLIEPIPESQSCVTKLSNFVPFFLDYGHQTTCNQKRIVNAINAKRSSTTSKIWPPVECQTPDDVIDEPTHVL
jgi:hypothetical protein